VATVAETDVEGTRDMLEVIGSSTRCALPVTYLGTPALSGPAEFISNELPSAFRLIGRVLAEVRLLAVGHARQCAVDRHEHVPAPS
jgi:Asp-tRNA(Asn)/Glu-tRNA(Gln) amidotransferase A subunit family amidase